MRLLDVGLGLLVVCLIGAAMFCFSGQYYTLFDDSTTSSTANPAETPRFSGPIEERPPVGSPSETAIRAEQTPPASGRWNAIVIHHSATRQGNAAIFDRYQRETKGLRDGLKYHFVVGNGTKSGDGEVEVGSRWTRQIGAPHTGNPDLDRNAISVCLVGNFNTGRPTGKQIDALNQLIQELCRKYRIRGDRVIRHTEVDGSACPGTHFPVMSR
jgi:N-acetyl-anhydromuramyl-L-alanine amidase AmpD